jgi:hypothetical protein
MIPKSSLFTLKKNYDAAIAGLVGALLIYLYSSHSGIGLEPDSITYVTTARSVVHGGGFSDYDGYPLIDFPIGYPAFLSLILFFSGVDLLQSGQVINMVLYFCLIYMSGGIINHIATKKRWIKIPFLILIVFSPALLGIYSMLLSETLFLVMTLLFFIALHQYGKQKKIQVLLIVALIAGLSCLVRYAGVTLIGAGGLMILFDRKSQIKQRIGHLLLFGTIGSAFWIGNILHNYLATGEMMGDRLKSITSFFQNVENYAKILGDFFYLNSFPIAFVVLTAIAFFAFYIYSHVIHIYKTNRYYNYWNILAVYFIVYSLFMVISSTFSRYETLDMRLLSPLYLPCLLPFTFIITWMISKLEGWKRYSLISFFALAFLVINYYQFKDDHDLYVVAKSDGIPGYAEESWKKAQLMDYLNKNKQQFKEGIPIYSNETGVVNLFTGLKPEVIPNQIFKVQNEYYIEGDEDAYFLVWIYTEDVPGFQSFKKLLTQHKYILLTSQPEGLVYFHPAIPKN